MGAAPRFEIVSESFRVRVMSRMPLPAWAKSNIRLKMGEVAGPGSRARRFLAPFYTTSLR